MSETEKKEKKWEKQRTGRLKIWKAAAITTESVTPTLWHTSTYATKITGESQRCECSLATMIQI
jgi:hypothetical protein